jgi:AAA family ATP:ADP antiporter
MLFLVGYSKLSNVFSSKSVLFYVTLLPFFIFYTAFAFILYPNRDLIHNLLPTATSTESAPISLLRYWSFSLYFIVSELWASAGVPLLFWTCANDVTKMDEARR